MAAVAVAAEAMIKVFKFIKETKERFAKYFQSDYNRTYAESGNVVELGRFNI